MNGWRRAFMAAALLALAGLTGCATAVPAAERDPRDPMEGWNRGVFRFNEAVDEALVKPVATTYRQVLPEPVRLGVGNFLGNLGDVWSTVNLVLQAKPREALEMGMRIGTNTLFGVAGLFDPATDLGLERQSEDLGQTLGRWGMSPGPFVMLPLLGPSTMRDSLALSVDTLAGPSAFVGGQKDKFALTGLQVINTRANLLGATRTLDGIALDKYILLRDATFARRRNLVYDGDPPEEETPPPAK